MRKAIVCSRSHCLAHAVRLGASSCFRSDSSLKLGHVQREVFAFHRRQVSEVERHSHDEKSDVTTAALDIVVQAATVDTGSGMKNSKLKSKDFFDVDKNPLITFKSDHCVQTGPMTFDVPGTFTIRGVSKPETLQLTLVGTKGSGKGTIKGSMAFDRKDYGINGRFLLSRSPTGLKWMSISM